MTSTDTGARTGTELLYLSVDLGDRPGLADYLRAVGGLQRLSALASDIVAPGDQARLFLRRAGAPSLRDSGFVVVRTSMASPWETVLASVAEHSAPVAYGAAALYGLHRLLNLVMVWQSHRLNIQEREVRLAEQRAKADIAQQVGEVVQDILSNAGLTKPPPGSESYLEYEEEVTDRTKDEAGVLGDIQVADLISPDDPRASSR